MSPSEGNAVKPIHTESFTHEGQEYEVRVRQDDAGFSVSAFKNNKPLGVRYSVTFAMASDLRLYQGTSGIDELVEIAKNDLRRGQVKAG
jgi:hypothetical protein